MTCDELLTALALGKSAAPNGGAAADHLATCSTCRAESTRAHALGPVLAAYRVGAPPAEAAARTLASAAPLLARRAGERRALRRRVAWALTLALLPLPAIVFANVKLLMAAHGLLLSVLPPSASTYLIVCLGAGVALLLALSYAAVPLLASRRPQALALQALALEDPDVHVPA
jgi:hypothetical protein